MTNHTEPRTRYPYVGDGPDGCRRSAAIDRTEAEQYDRVFDAPVIADLLESAAEWEAQAAREEAGQ